VASVANATGTVVAFFASQDARVNFDNVPLGGVAALEAPVQVAQAAAVLAQLVLPGLEVAARAEQLRRRRGDAGAVRRGRSRPC